MSLAVKIGERLKAVRRENGMTQETLAQKINTSHDVVSNVERGRTNASAVELIAAFCSVLDISLEDLFANIDGPKVSGEKHRYIFEINRMLEGMSERECRRIRDLAKVSIED